MMNSVGITSAPRYSRFQPRMPGAAEQGSDAWSSPRVSVMQRIYRIAIGCLFLAVVAGLLPLRADESTGGPRPLKMADVLAWKHITGVSLSHDGQWFAYLLAPNEGDGEVVVRQMRGDKELRFPCGEARGGPFAAGGGPVFSDDSQWVA